MISGREFASNARLKKTRPRLWTGRRDKELRECVMLRDVSKALRQLRRILGDGFGGSYRPDLHYMRGPGPKWHAKHAGFVAAPPAAKPSHPALHDIAGHRA
jgi:hypothetical protein